MNLALAPSPLFPKLALLAASTLGFGVAYMSSAMPAVPAAPSIEPRLLGTYAYDPGRLTGVIVDLGDGPVSLPLREAKDGAQLVWFNDSQAVIRIDGKRHKLYFEPAQPGDYARRPAPPPEPIQRAQKTQPQLLATYILQPSGVRGAVVDLGSGPVDYKLGELHNDTTLIYVAASYAVLMGERHWLILESVPEGTGQARAEQAQPGPCVR